MLLLWTGEKHSGKTTAAMRLVDSVRADGFSVAGLLAPSIYCQGELVGFDALDIATDAKCPLARRVQKGETLPPDTVRAGRFRLLPEGIELGEEALRSQAAQAADLVVIDEFGPLELDGGGWRPAVDALVGRQRGAVLLVVRRELAEAVRRLYEDHCPLVVATPLAEEAEKTRKILDDLSRALKM